MLPAPAQCMQTLSSHVACPGKKIGKVSAVLVFLALRVHRQARAYACMAYYSSYVVIASLREVGTTVPTFTLLFAFAFLMTASKKSWVALLNWKCTFVRWIVRLTITVIHEICSCRNELETEMFAE